MTVQEAEEIRNPVPIIQVNGYGIVNTTTINIIVCGMIAGLIMIIAYKYSQKRRQKYIKCDELLQENQDFGGNLQSSTFPFVVSNEDDDSEDEELLNEIDCYQKDQKAHRIV